MIFGTNLGPVVAVILTVIDYAIRLVALIFIPVNRKPQTATAWLLAIFLVPTVGILLFALFGSIKLPRKRRAKQLEINHFITDSIAGLDETNVGGSWPGWLGPIVELNQKLGAMPMVGGNTAKLYTNYADSIAAMTRAVGKSKK